MLAKLTRKTENTWNEILFSNQTNTSMLITTDLMKKLWSTYVHIHNILYTIISVAFRILFQTASKKYQKSLQKFAQIS